MSEDNPNSKDFPPGTKAKAWHLRRERLAGHASSLVQVVAMAVRTRWAQIKSDEGFKLNHEETPGDLRAALLVGVARGAISCFKWSGFTLPQALFTLAEQWDKVTINQRTVDPADLPHKDQMPS